MREINNSLAILVIGAALILSSACRSTQDDPSPGSMAEPPPEEAQEVDLAPEDEETAARLHEVMQIGADRGLAERPVGEIVQVLGQEFMSRPYLIGPLDGFDREVLVTRLDAFDCFTYVEALLAVARGLKAGDATYGGYQRRTEQQRYRNGEMGDYCSRLHYFTDWIRDNERRGLVRDITREIGGDPLPKQYGFMGAHRESYPRLVDNDELYACIVDMEARLNENVDLYYVPQDRIRGVYPQLQPGDIIATATDIEGLDVTHTGFVYKEADGQVGLLHASTDGGVKISPDLQDYVQGVNAQIGIIVTRPLAP